VIDLVVENLTLSGCNLFPNITLIEANNFIKFSLTSTASSSLSLSRRCKRDVVFYFRRKTEIKITGRYCPQCGRSHIMFCFAAFVNGRADVYCTGDCIFRQGQTSILRSQALSPRSTRSNFPSTTRSTTSLTRHSSHSLHAHQGEQKSHQGLNYDRYGVHGWPTHQVLD
jgi:Family of unknown function (DUF5923)